MSYNPKGLEAQQKNNARLTALLTSNFAFLTRHGNNPQECRKWLEQQTTEDRLLLEGWLDRTSGIQTVLLTAKVSYIR